MNKENKANWQFRKSHQNQNHVPQQFTHSRGVIVLKSSATTVCSIMSAMSNNPSALNEVKLTCLFL